MKKIYLQVLFLLVSGIAVSQTRIYSVIGSSTAAGTGASVADSCWVNRLTNYYQSVGATILPHNLAVPGRNCYQGMPTGYIPPPGRDFPQVTENITMALSFTPEVVIISYPTNNYNIYSISEIMNCLQTMKNMANAQGKICYITTSQPRQDGLFPDLAARTILKVIRDSIMNRFTNYAIDFFTAVTDPALYTILPQYSFGDGIHLNDRGHRVLFELVKAKNIFNLVVPVKLSDFSAEPLTKKVYTSWKVMDETPGVEYSLQRSKDGMQFENVFAVRSSTSKRMNHYQFIDQPGNAGVYFYRLMIDDNGSRISSGTKKVIINDVLSMKIIMTTRSKLRMTLGSDERQNVDVRVVNSVGATIRQSRKTLNAGFTDIEIPTNSLPVGLYWVEVRGSTSHIVHEFLKK